MPEMLASLRRDAAQASRALRHHPSYALTAIVTLALGIGATTAIFTVAHAVLMRPLPFPEPERILLVTEGNPSLGFPRFAASPPNFYDYRERNRTFEALAAMSRATFTWTAPEADPERLEAQQVTADFLRVFGIQPRLGRDFIEADDHPDAPLVAILSHDLWQRRFGGEDEVLGQVMQLNGEAYEIVGVLPAGLELFEDVLLPLAVGNDPEMRGNHFLTLRGRLADGADLAAARRDLARVAAQLESEYPESNEGWVAVVDPLLDRVVAEVRPALRLLLGTAGLVLLIACANVANLMLARTSERERELALRTALGAGRGQLVRQLIVEAAMLAFVGGGLALLIAWRAVPILVALAGERLPRTETIGIDGPVLLFALATALGTVLLFGLWPALRASRQDPRQMLEQGGRGNSEDASSARVRQGLVLAEVALATLLLVGAGLSIRTVSELLDIDPGFRPEGVLTASLELPIARFASDEEPVEPALASFHARLLEEMRALPGVVAAGSIFPMPLAGGDWVLLFQIEGRQVERSQDRPLAYIRLAGAGYFDTVGIPVVRGRVFDDRDRIDSESVVVINETAAQRFFPAGDVLGQRVLFGDPDAEDARWRRIVGVVGDVRHAELGTPAEPEIYLPNLQDPGTHATLVLRTAGDPMTAVGPLRETLRRLDPEIALDTVRTLRGTVDAAVAQPRLNRLLLGLFAAVALLLAAVGVYGVVRLSVHQRLREIGIRMALGADRRDIVVRVLRQGLGPVVVGIALGLVVAWAAGRLVESMVYGVTPRDPMTFTWVAVALGAVALGACGLPTLRATRIDPMVVLRNE